MDIDEFTNYRKFLHRFPELSGSEYKTSEYISAQLAFLCPDAEIYKIGDTGIVASIEGKEKGNHILFRAELDALPIQEVNQFDHRSESAGVSHKCGHDGHMIILLAVAKHIQEYKLQKGKISLLFQPAEENGEGAKMVLEDPFFNAKINPDFVFALHNVPGYPLHSIVLKPNNFTPSVISVKIKLFGKTTHAAEPENGTNPTYAISQIIQEVIQYEITDQESNQFRLFTPIFISVGSESFGTAAGNGEIGFTIRTWSNKEMNMIRLWFEKMVLDVTQKNRLLFDINWIEEFRSVENNNEAMTAIRTVAKNSSLQIIEKPQPFKWGEDFGLFTEKYRGAMFGLGAGLKAASLHNPDYDFPDSLIKTGKNTFINLISILQK